MCLVAVVGRLAPLPFFSLCLKSTSPPVSTAPLDHDRDLDLKGEDEGDLGHWHFACFFSLTSGFGFFCFFCFVRFLLVNSTTAIATK